MAIDKATSPITGRKSGRSVYYARACVSRLNASETLWSVAAAPRAQNQTGLRHIEAVSRRELGQVVKWELHRTGDVEDRLVALPEAISIAHEKEGRTGSAEGQGSAGHEAGDVTA